MGNRTTARVARGTIAPGIVKEGPPPEKDPGVKQGSPKLIKAVGAGVGKNISPSTTQNPQQTKPHHPHTSNPTKHPPHT